MTTNAAFDCTETVQRLWDFIDRELPADARDAVAAHVASCASCDEHLRYLTAFLDQVRRAPIDDAAMPALHRRISAALRAVAVAEG